MREPWGAGREGEKQREREREQTGWRGQIMNWLLGDTQCLRKIQYPMATRTPTNT